MRSSQIIKEDWVTITAKVASWVAVAGLIVSAILALAIGGVIFGLQLRVKEVTMIMMDKYRAGDAQSVDLLVVQAISPIRWEG